MNFVRYVPDRREEELDFQKYFANQTGHGYVRLQRGTGLGAVFGRAVHTVAPVAKVAVKQDGKTDVKTKKTAPQSTKNQSGEGVGSRPVQHTLKGIKGQRKRKKSDAFGPV